MKSRISKNKVREIFSLGATAKGTIYYLPNDPSLNIVKGLFNQSYKKNEKFFRREINKVELILLYNRQEMDELVGFKSQNWMVGYANSAKSQIFIFSPWVFENVSCHCEREFERVLCHEIAHLFIKSIDIGFKPQWLNEGLACFIAGQNNLNGESDIKFNPQMVFLLNTSRQWNKNVKNRSLRAYWQSWRAVNYLIKQYGKNRLLQLLSLLGNNSDEKMFYIMFKSIYTGDVLEIMEQIRD